MLGLWLAGITMELREACRCYGWSESLRPSGTTIEGYVKGNVSNFKTHVQTGYQRYINSRMMVMISFRYCKTRQGLGNDGGAVFVVGFNCLR